MTTTPEDDPRVEALLREATSRDAEPLSRRDRLAESGIALALVAVIVCLALWLPGPAGSPWLAGALLAVQLVAHRIRFAVGSCRAVATQVAVVPMLLLLHPALVLGLLVASGVLGRAPEYLRGRTHPDHAVFAFGDSWYAVGPALVISAAAGGGPALDHWPIYLAALVAQLLCDTVATAARVWLALGVPPNLQLRLQVVGFAIDAALSPIGLLLALVAHAQPAAIVLVLPPPNGRSSSATPRTASTCSTASAASWPTWASSCAATMSAGTAAAIPTGSWARRSRSPPGSSARATPTAP